MDGFLSRPCFASGLGVTLFADGKMSVFGFLAGRKGFQREFPAASLAYFCFHFLEDYFVNVYFGFLARFTVVPSPRRVLRFLHPCILEFSEAAAGVVSFLTVHSGLRAIAGSGVPPDALGASIYPPRQISGCSSFCILVACFEIIYGLYYVNDINGRLNASEYFSHWFVSHRCLING